MSVVGATNLQPQMLSTWERNIARVLDLLKIRWEYEPRGFPLANGLNYWPDFYLPDRDQWVEVKGLVNEVWEAKLALFRDAHHSVRLKVIGPKEYVRLRDKYKDRIKDWEFPVRKRKARPRADEEEDF